MTPIALEPESAGKKSLLMVDYFFPPWTGAAVRRTAGLARSLPQHGWLPTVLTSRPERIITPQIRAMDALLEEVIVWRARSLEPIRFIKSVLRRFNRSAHGELPPGVSWLGSRRTRILERYFLFPDRYLGWLPFALGMALSRSRNYVFDVVYSTFSDAMTSHFVGYLLKKQLGKPWVADFQDPWTENYFYDLPTRAHARLARRLERLVMSSADRITVTTERHRQILFQQYPFLQSHRVRVVPLGFHEEDFERNQTRPAETRFTMTHFGNFHSRRSPVAFLTALARCCAARPSFASKAHIVFLGAFDEDAWRAQKRIVSENQLRTIVEIKGTVEYRVGLQYLDASDVLLLIMDESGWGENMTPCKLFDYLPTRKPILALAPEGSTATIIRSASAGLVVPPDDVRAIQTAILHLYDRWERGALKINSDKRYIHNFEWKSVTGDFARILDDLISEASKSSHTCGS